MSDNSTQNPKSNNFIDSVEITNDTLTSRGGLSLFVRYLRNIGLLSHLESEFGGIRKSRKRQAVAETGSDQANILIFYLLMENSRLFYGLELTFRTFKI